MAELMVAGWFMSTIISKTADLMIYYVKCNKNVSGNLKKLKTHLEKIKAVIHEAEQRRTNNPGLQLWLSDLKGAMYSAEDVLDTFSYEILSERARNSKKVGDAVALDNIVKKFKDIVDQMETFLRVVEMNDNNAGNRLHTKYRRLTTPSQPQPVLIGRYTELTELKAFLHQPASDGNRISSISLLGVGGVGKTAIARLTYHDPSLKWRFDIKAWVCVTHVFDEKSLLIKFIESANLERPADLHQIENLDVIQNIIQKGLKGKRFLVVFDDVWRGEFSDWFSVPFSYGEEGSKIVVTTRHKSIATQHSTMKKMINVEGLKFNECLDLLYKHAIHHLEKTAYPLLEHIGHEITKDLCGLPLVVETIGCALGQNLSENHWREIMSRNIYTVQIDQQQENILLESMRLSYEQLNNQSLRQCFLSCSLFPFGHEFNKTELIRIWMALGFLNSANRATTGRTMESLGESYFNELVNRQFFKKVHGVDNYEMHGALHQLSEYLSHGEYYRFNPRRDYGTGSSGIDIPDTVRHVGLDVNDLSRASSYLENKTNLWSLIITGQRSYYLPKKENPLLKIEKILKGQKCLRVLILSDLLPKSFDQPIHLRYFKVGVINDDDTHGGTITLPDWLRACYQLQSFSAEFVHNKVKLPNHMNRLIMLRWLDTNPATVHTIAGIGTMVSLREMSEFHVQRNGGFEVKQLGKMNELKGHLCISNLENVDKVDDAMKAELHEKKHLRSLVFRWSKGKVRKLPDDVVLEKLRPCKLILKIELNGYMGAKFPKWFGQLAFQQLSLINCGKLDPELVELKDMLSLKVLNVHNCPVFHNIPKNLLPPNLEKLMVDGHNGDLSGPRNNAPLANDFTRKKRRSLGDHLENERNTRPRTHQ